jgi:hypothetical protein
MSSITYWLVGQPWSGPPPTPYPPGCYLFSSQVTTSGVDFGIGGATVTYPVTANYKIDVYVYRPSTAEYFLYGTGTVSRTAAGPSDVAGVQTTSIPNGTIGIYRTDQICIMATVWFSVGGSGSISAGYIWINATTPPSGGPGYPHPSTPQNYLSFGDVTLVSMYTELNTAIVPTYPLPTTMASAWLSWGQPNPKASYFTYNYTNTPVRIMSVKTTFDGIIGIAGRTIAEGISGFSQVRMAKNGTTYIVDTGLTTNPLASPLRIQTASGIRSFLKL